MGGVNFVDIGLVATLDVAALVEVFVGFEVEFAGFVEVALVFAGFLFFPGDILLLAPVSLLVEAVGVLVVGFTFEAIGDLFTFAI